MLWTGVIVLGSLAYIALKDNDNTKENIETVKEDKATPISEICYEKTYKYFMDGLTLDEQIEYVNWNYYLSDYAYLLGNSKYHNAKKMASVSAKLNKQFINKNCRY